MPVQLRSFILALYSGGYMGIIKQLLLLLLYPVLVNASQIEVLYTWSPMMPLSIQGLTEINQHCHDNHYTCHFVLDPFLSINDIDPTLLPYAESQDLTEDVILAGILNHFPAYAVFVNGILQGNVHLGYLHPDMLTTIIQRRLQ